MIEVGIILRCLGFVIFKREILCVFLKGFICYNIFILVLSSIFLKE